MSQKPIPRPIAVRVDDAANMIGLSVTELYRLLKEGSIEARKKGVVTLVLVASLDSYVANLPKATFG